MCRNGCSEDQRHWQLFPTEKALLLYDQIITEENTSLQLCLQNFTASERKELNRLFKKMCANLETHWQKTKGQKQRIEVQ